jgi:hypothetical protein
MLLIRKLCSGTLEHEQLMGTILIWQQYVRFAVHSRSTTNGLPKPEPESSQHYPPPKTPSGRRLAFDPSPPTLPSMTLIRLLTMIPYSGDDLRNHVQMDVLARAHQDVHIPSGA